MKKGVIGMIVVIVGGIVSAVGSALLTVDTSEKVLNKFVDDVNNDIARLEANDEDDLDNDEYEGS